MLPADAPISLRLALCFHCLLRLGSPAHSSPARQWRHRLESRPPHPLQEPSLAEGRCLQGPARAKIRGADAWVQKGQPEAKLSYSSSPSCGRRGQAPRRSGGGSQIGTSPASPPPSLELS